MSTQPTIPSSRSTAQVSRLFTLILLGLMFTLTGCGPRITITWDSPKQGVLEDTALRLAGVDVGRVTSVQTEGDHFLVQARIRREHADSVKADSTFVLHPARGIEPAYIEIVTLRAESPPIADGAVVSGSATETGARLRTLTSDWPRNLAIVGAGVVALALTLVLAKLLFKVWSLMFCVVAGLAGAYFVSPYALPYLGRWIPPDFRPDLLSYVAGFLAAYLAALILVALLRAPFTAARE